MNPMLELSMDADYDILAACLIFAAAIAGKCWMQFKNKAVNRAE